MGEVGLKDLYTTRKSSVTTPLPTPSTPPTPSAKHQRLRDEARDAWLVLQAAAEGYRQNVRSIDQKQAWLDGLSALVSIWLVVVLWGIKEIIPHGEHQIWVSTVINVLGTFLAIAVVSLLIMSWRQEWRGTTEKHRHLADQADRLAARYFEIFQEDELDEGRMTKAKQDQRTFVSEENQPLGGVPTWARQKGFQHVGQAHPTQNVRCNTCGRNWDELKLEQGSWKGWFRFNNCKTCGVPK